MSRRYEDHFWIAGDGRRGLRGARADRCKRCGLNRAKRNGDRIYFWGQPYIGDDLKTAPRCDPKKLQPQLDLAPAAKGHARIRSVSLRSKGQTPA